jgi:hypothetical protein
VNNPKQCWTYLGDGERVNPDDKLVRGETPDGLLVGGVAERTEGFVALGGETHDNELAVLSGEGAYGSDHLVLVGAGDVGDRGVVRDTSELVVRGCHLRTRGVRQRGVMIVQGVEVGWEVLVRGLEWGVVPSPSVEVRWEVLVREAEEVLCQREVLCRRKVEVLYERRGGDIPWIAWWWTGGKKRGFEKEEKNYL